MIPVRDLVWKKGCTYMNIAIPAYDDEESNVELAKSTANTQPDLSTSTLHRPDMPSKEGK
jgi:hypothetical protein